MNEQLTNFKTLDNEISANNPNKNEQDLVTTLLQNIFVSDEIITEFERATRGQAHEKRTTYSIKSS